MRLRLPQRMSQRTGWIVVACLAAPFVLLFVSPFVYVSLSMYWQWHRGYGFACESETTAETFSPSRQWIAKTRIVSCGGLAGGRWIEAVLVPNAALPFLVQYRRVFVREIGSSSDVVPGGDRLSITWKDDHSLELRGALCEPCQSLGYQRPCDSQCGVINDVSGITVSLTN